MKPITKRERKEALRDAHLQVAAVMLEAMRYRKVGFGFISKKVGNGYNARKVFDNVMRQRGDSLRDLALFMRALDMRLGIKTTDRHEESVPDHQEGE